MSKCQQKKIQKNKKPIGQTRGGSSVECRMSSFADSSLPLCRNTRIWAPESRQPRIKEAWLSSSDSIRHPWQIATITLYWWRRMRESRFSPTFPIKQGIFIELVAKPIAKHMASSTPRNSAMSSSSFFWSFEFPKRKFVRSTRQKFQPNLTEFLTRAAKCQPVLINRLFSSIRTRARVFSKTEVVVRAHIEALCCGFGEPKQLSCNKRCLKCIDGITQRSIRSRASLYPSVLPPPLVQSKLDDSRRLLSECKYSWCIKTRSRCTEVQSPAGHQLSQYWQSFRDRSVQLLHSLTLCFSNSWAITLRSTPNFRIKSRK